MLSISGRNFRVRDEVWQEHLQGAMTRRGLASAQEIALLYRTLARFNVMVNDPDTAELYLDTAQWAAERSGDKRLVTLATYSRAQLLRGRERWGEAFRMALAANAMAEQLDDDLVKAATYNLSGFIRGRLGDLDGAVKDLTASQAFADSMGNNSLRFLNRSNWGYMMEVKGHWREALEQYRALHDAVSTTGEELEWLPEVELGIGYMLLRLDSVDQAEAVLGRLHRMKTMVGHPYEQAFNTAWALLQLRLGNYQQAISSAHTAYVTDQIDENDVVKRDASRILSDAYVAIGLPGEALKWNELAHQWKDSVLYRDQANDALRTELNREMMNRVMQDSLAHAQETARAEFASQQRLYAERNRRNIFLFAALGLLVFGVVVYRQRGRIRIALHRSDELLLNILPEEVAEELKMKGHADAKHFDNANILFTDFKGFTEASEKLTPQELVEELNTCFKAFDNIITARGIEKIKTIGDAYMCASGLPDPKTSSPADVVHAALEMQAFMIARKKERDALNKPAFEMRLGIHTGPVVAGIVGVKKFQYDIWGDTVNTASRMESSGEVGQVNISEATYALVKGEAGLTFTPRGKVQAKGKGEMEMYFVQHSYEGT
ncbi:MAG: adenylate/guanylate cyclase domain-containing protein [Flavobacteriales bacterium]